MDAFDEIPFALGKHARLMLATVIATSGSTPASAHSRMLIGGNGERLAGTVGGGCVEADVIAAARRLSGEGKCSVMTFTLDEDHLESGMLCGGTLGVFIEPFAGPDLPFVEMLRERRESGDDSIRGTLVSGEGRMLARFLVPAGLPGADLHERAGESLPSRLDAERAGVIAAIEDVGRRGIARALPVREGNLIIERVAGAPGLFIFGGGHVSLSVCRIASAAGFRVTVIDDRPEFANAVRFPEAARTIAADFLESFNQITIKPSSYIVIVTRGHKADELVLGAAVTTPAGYIGMIGSRKKVAAAFANLEAQGVSREVFRRVCAPIGLDIGAVTPDEIAVSIVGELIHSRRSPGSPLGFKSDRHP